MNDIQLTTSPNLSKHDEEQMKDNNNLENKNANQDPNKNGTDD